MKHERVSSGKRKSVNLSIDTGIVAYARENGVNMSQVSEAAIKAAARDAHDAAWKAENRDWIESHRQWVERNELPLEKHRLF